jgi:hypothetical protein
VAQNQGNEMKAGDWAVIRDSWATYVREIERVTDKCVYAGGEYSSRAHRHDRHKILFAGPEAVAQLLANRLVSSHAQCNEDCRKAQERRDRRDADLIAKATAEVPSTNTEHTARK